MNILIKNGRIIDGTGNPWYYGEVEIEDGKIKRMARKLGGKAGRVIDADGLIVTPGFIDTHCHTDGYCLSYPEMAPYVLQGITTETLGHDGYSPFPDKQSYVEHAASSPWASLWYADEVRKSEHDWHSLTEYRQLISEIGLGIDIAPLIGYGTIGWKAGYRVIKAADVRRPTAKEFEEMKRLTRKGMEEGAFGLSQSMDYPPQRYAEAAELIELAKIAAEYNGVFAIHTRNIALPDGLREAGEVAKKAGVKLRIVHIGRRRTYLPLPGITNTLPENLGILERMRSEGMDVTADVMQTVDFGAAAELFKYTFFNVCMDYAPQPPEGVKTFDQFQEKLKTPKFREEVKQTVIKYIGDACRYYKDIYERNLGVHYLLINTGDEELEGKALGIIAQEKGLNAQDLFFDIAFGTSPLIAKGAKPSLIYSGELHEDIKKASAHWLSMPSTDMVPRPNPDLVPWYAPYITMPRFFRDSIDSGIRMEEAIRKMTSFPAQSWGLYDRGLLRPGMKADIVILDPEEYRPLADFWHPSRKPAGVSYVLVNGKLVMDQGVLTKERPGKILAHSEGKESMLS